MLSLQSSSAARWLAQVDAVLEEVLIDHAHCEKKAAGVGIIAAGDQVPRMHS